MAVLIAICLSIIVAAMIDGFRHGVIQRAVETLGLIFIFIFASRLADWIQPGLTSGLSASPRAAFFVSWAIVIIGGIILVRIAAGAFASLTKISIIGSLDHLGGAVMGLLFGSLFVSVLLVGVLAVSDSPRLRREIHDHPITGPLLDFAPEVYDVVAQTWHGESFFKMIESRLEPIASQTKDNIKAYMSEHTKDGTKEQ
jgi:uncharacterized membrane protein required for colicin V production